MLGLNKKEKVEEPDDIEMMSFGAGNQQRFPTNKGMRFRVVTVKNEDLEDRDTKIDIESGAGYTSFKKGGAPATPLDEVADTKETTFLVVDNDENEQYIWRDRMQTVMFLFVICILIGIGVMILGAVAVGYIAFNTTSNDHLADKGIAIVLNMINKLMQNVQFGCGVVSTANGLCSTLGEMILGMPINCNLTPQQLGFQVGTCVPLPTFDGTVNGSEIHSILSENTPFYDQVSALKNLHDTTPSST